MSCSLRHRQRRPERGFSLMELMVTLAIIALMSSIAIPAFMGYLRKAKSTEARGQLEKLYSGARGYYLEHSAFPPSAPAITPALGSCCFGGGDRCVPARTLWSDETWIALNFAMDDPHYYSYQYTTSASSSSFFVRAHGDLDCDGKFSTFQMMGEINSVYSDGPSGSASIYKIDEQE